MYVNQQEKNRRQLKLNSIYYLICRIVGQLLDSHPVKRALNIQACNSHRILVIIGQLLDSHPVERALNIQASNSHGILVLIGQLFPFATPVIKKPL